MKSLVITITGPSCSGKSTLARELASRGVPEIISTTTRAKRAGEIDGQHYNFVQREEFDELLASKRVIQFVTFNGDQYGSTEGALAKAISTSDAGICCIVVEPSGVPQFQAAAATMGFNFVSVFVGGDPDVLVRRYLNRITSGEVSNESAVSRIRKLIEVEIPTWATAANYDIWLDGLDDDHIETSTSEIARWLSTQAIRLT